MNRLVIIGNGFDLAHGLPTSYKDFIDDYWKTICDTKGTKTIKHNDELVSLNCEFGGLYNSSEYYAIDNLNSYDELKKFIARNQNKYGEFSLVFNNLFFQKICDNSIENWVDIENEYYRLLKEIANEVLPIANPTLKDKEQLIKRKKAKTKNSILKINRKILNNKNKKKISIKKQNKKKKKKIINKKKKKKIKKKKIKYLLK